MANYELLLVPLLCGLPAMSFFAIPWSEGVGILRFRIVIAVGYLTIAIDNKVKVKANIHRQTHIPQFK
jgi:hypothetical protein